MKQKHQKQKIQIVNLNEKQLLGVNIRKLNNEQLKGIIRIIQNNSIRDKKERYFEFDIDKLTPQKCRELENYVRSCLGVQYWIIYLRNQ